MEESYTNEGRFEHYEELLKEIEETLNPSKWNFNRQKRTPIPEGANTEDFQAVFTRVYLTEGDLKQRLASIKWTFMPQTASLENEVQK